MREVEQIQGLLFPNVPVVYLLGFILGDLFTNSSGRPGAESNQTVIDQGCQMPYFQNKNPNLRTFGRDLQWKM
jgi:hypothetical protein